MHEKNIRLTAALYAAACALILLTGCGSKGRSADGAKAFATDSISYSDSITAPGGNKAVCNISIDYPADGKLQVSDSVREWIAASLATDCYISADPNPSPFAVEASLRNNGDKLIKAVTEKVLASAMPYLLSLDSLKIDPPTTCEYYRNITRMYQTDKFVTFGNASYAYLGGAHGSSAFNGQVFSLTDGTSYGWNMFRPEALAQLRVQVQNGIMTQYFKTSSPEEFKQMILLSSNATGFPLPASAPYFMADGVHFDYQQYEIAPYAAGMPSCVIPYAEIAPLLTPDAAALLATE